MRDKKVMKLAKDFSSGKLDLTKDRTAIDQLTYYREKELFWSLLVEQKAIKEVNDLAEMARDILTTMINEDLIDFEDMALDFADRIKCDPESDVGLRTHFQEAFQYFAMCWTENENEALYNTLDELEQNWMWDGVFQAMVDEFYCENEWACEVFRYMNLA